MIPDNLIEKYLIHAKSLIGTKGMCIYENNYQGSILSHPTQNCLKKCFIFNSCSGLKDKFRTEYSCTTELALLQAKVFFDVFHDWLTWNAAGGKIPPSNRLIDRHLRQAESIIANKGNCEFNPGEKCTEFCFAFSKIINLTDKERDNFQCHPEEAIQMAERYINNYNKRREILSETDLVKDYLEHANYLIDNKGKCCLTNNFDSEDPIIPEEDCRHFCFILDSKVGLSCNANINYHCEPWMAEVIAKEFVKNFGPKPKSKPIQEPKSKEEVIESKEEHGEDYPFSDKKNFETIVFYIRDLPGLVKKFLPMYISYMRGKENESHFAWFVKVKCFTNDWIIKNKVAEPGDLVILIKDGFVYDKGNVRRRR